LTYSSGDVYHGAWFHGRKVGYGIQVGGKWVIASGRREVAYGNQAGGKGGYGIQVGGKWVTAFRGWKVGHGIHFGFR
jgi:hypothetical protein